MNQFVVITLLAFYITHAAQQSCGQITAEITCSSTPGCTYLNNECKCSSSVKLDILFAIDASRSIGYDGFQIQKTFIKGLVNNGISDDSARIGFTIFASNINTSVEIKEWPVKDELLNYVEGIYWTEGYTNTLALLTSAMDTFQATFDPDRKQVLLMITDGNPCAPDSQGGCPQNVCSQAPLIKAQGIRVVIIGVGTALTADYIDCLLQSNEDYIPVASFSDDDFDRVLGSLSDVLCPSNLLCNDEAWNIIKGDWFHNPNECVLYQSESGTNDLIWFGSEDGLIPNPEFDHQSFELTVTMSVESRSSTAAYSASGFFFRSSQSLEAPQGPDYWIMLYPVQNRLVFSQMNAANAKEEGTDKWIKLGEKDLPFDVIYGQVYTIKVEALADYTYVVSISNNDEWYTIYGSFKNAKDLRFGSIGLRTLNVPSIFYSVRYVPL